jgi:hypothetical protein
MPEEEEEARNFFWVMQTTRKDARERERERESIVCALQTLNPKP